MTAKEAEVVIRRIERDRDHERDTTRIAVGVAEEKNGGAGVERDMRKIEATKGETWEGAEKDVGTGVVVKTKIGINEIREGEAGAERESSCRVKLFANIKSHLYLVYTM